MWGFDAILYQSECRQCQKTVLSYLSIFICGSIYNSAVSEVLCGFVPNKTAKIGKIAWVFLAFSSKLYKLAVLCKF